MAFDIHKNPSTVQFIHDRNFCFPTKTTILSYLRTRNTYLCSTRIVINIKIERSKLQVNLASPYWKLIWPSVENEKAGITLI